ncbi:DUF5071 domain-containing protein [Paenibacillus terrae]
MDFEEESQQTTPLGFMNTGTLSETLTTGIKKGVNNININELIPRDKDDFERVGLLKKQSIEKLKPILPELLEWLQDGNWPVAEPIENVLLNFEEELIPYIRRIFRTNDGCWKYFLLHGLIRKLPDYTLKELKADLNRMLNAPTEDEKQEELNDILIELLERAGS